MGGLAPNTRLQRAVTGRRRHAVNALRHFALAPRLMCARRLNLILRRLELRAMRCVSVAMLFMAGFVARSVHAEDLVAVPSAARCDANHRNEPTYRDCIEAVLEDSRAALDQAWKAVDARLQQRITSEERPIKVMSLKRKSLAFGMPRWRGRSIGTRNVTWWRMTTWAALVGRQGTENVLLT